MKKQLLFGTLVLVGLFSSINSFAQTAYTFTNCGATGRFGPTQTQVNSTYTGTNTLTGAVTVNTQGIQEWTVPSSGLYRIEALGASGNQQTGKRFGTGARMIGEFNLTAGQVLKVVVGQRGISSVSAWEGCGGGGASFVVDTFNNTPLVVAAGGAGGNGNGNYPTRPIGVGSSTTGNPALQGLAQGTSRASGAGGGFNLDGQDGYNVGTGGKSFVNGVVGGVCSYGNAAAHGGFGGGGAGDWYTMGGAGGGYQGGSTKDGYTNTDGTTDAYSYNNGANQSNTSGSLQTSSTFLSDGIVIITQLCPSVAPSLSCVSSMSVGSDSSSCGRIVNYATPSDPCATVTQTSGLASGSLFPIGTTTNTFIATNSFGSDTCTFNVTVIDSIVPTLSCPSNVITCNSVVNNIGPTFSDNCNVNVIYTLSGATTGSGTNDASGTTFNVGVTTLQYTVSDSSGNTSNCSFTITNNTVDTSVTRNLSTFTSNETGATYQWLNCDSNNIAITGATNQSYTATTNGSYAVVVSKNGCTDTSACQMINNVGISTNEFGNISIYPNPTNGLFTIDMGSYDEAVNYTVSSIDGRVVTQKLNVTDNKITIDLGNESKGVYLLKLHNHKSSSVFRVTRL
jgi:hypothetical protein